MQFCIIVFIMEKELVKRTRWAAEEMFAAVQYAVANHTKYLVRLNDAFI
jgi:hypothetical protein